MDLTTSILLLLMTARVAFAQFGFGDGAQGAADALDAEEQAEENESDAQDDARDRPAAILSHRQELGDDGTFNYAFSADNGLQQKEMFHPDGSRTGSYSYVDPHGETVLVNYRADKFGFQVLDGSTIPTSTPPREVQSESNSQPLVQHHHQQQQQQLQRPNVVHQRPILEQDRGFRNRPSLALAAAPTFRPLTLQTRSQDQYRKGVKGRNTRGTLYHGHDVDALSSEAQEALVRLSDENEQNDPDDGSYEKYLEKVQNDPGLYDDGSYDKYIAMYDDGSYDKYIAMYDDGSYQQHAVKHDNGSYQPHAAKYDDGSYKYL